MCRITVNGQIAQFSCKLDVEEKSWNVELGRVSGRSIAAQEANRMLDKIRVGINQAYQKIADRDSYVTAEKVRNAYLGLGMNHETLLAVFWQHNEDYEKQVGKLKSLRSYWKHCVVYRYLAEFVEKRYKVSKIVLRPIHLLYFYGIELDGYGAPYSRNLQTAFNGHLWLNTNRQKRVSRRISSCWM